ncbi:hypothetical protein EMIT0357P_20203 [Pseudomonas marginalis]
MFEFGMYMLKACFFIFFVIENDSVMMMYPSFIIFSNGNPQW